MHGEMWMEHQLSMHTTEHSMHGEIGMEHQLSMHTTEHSMHGGSKTHKDVVSRPAVGYVLLGFEGWTVLGFEFF
jgi:hypothetical protein